MTQPEISLADHESLQAELAICCRQLQSKDQALRILKEELDLSSQQMEHSRQEIAQLRSQLARSSSVPQEDRVHEKERYIAQLEECQERISELERLLQMEEDSKEEVMGERDYFSSRCSSLMKCLEEKENAQPPSQSTLQTLAEENRQLKLQLVEVQAARDQAQARSDRYKRAFEHRKAKDLQQQQLMSSGKHNSLRQAMRQVTELESLANSLSESVKEKSIALSHQKKANKMLGKRIAELEHRLKVLEISGLWTASSEDPHLTWNEDSKLGSELEKDSLQLLTPEKLGPVLVPQSHSPLTSPSQPSSHSHPSQLPPHSHPSPNHPPTGDTWRDQIIPNQTTGEDECSQNQTIGGDKSDQPRLNQTTAEDEYGREESQSEGDRTSPPKTAQ